MSLQTLDRLSDPLRELIWAASMTDRPIFFSRLQAYILDEAEVWEAVQACQEAGVRVIGVIPKVKGVERRV